MNIIFSHKTPPLDEISKVGTKLLLLAKNNEVEIIHQSIAANRPFVLRPCDTHHAFEFIYVLSGQFKQSDTNQIFSSGDYITAENLEQNFYFHSLAEVKLLYITNIPVFDNLKQQITKLNQLLEQYPGNRLSKMIELAVKIGLELDLSDNQLYQLAYAIALFDFGNSGTNPDIKSVLGHIDNYDFNRIVDIIIQQHERYDGNGHPYGLAGEEILIETQILAVVLAYDSMTFRESGQIFLEPKEVRALLEAEKGYRYSPEVIETLISLEYS